jgi:hypothetical protein
MNSTFVKRKRPNLKLQGCGVALFGAFVLAYLGLNASGLEAVFISAYAVLVASWIVVPIGLLLGFLLPSFVAGSSVLRAGMIGAITGICVGLVTGILSKPLFGGGGDYSHIPSMVAVCAVCVGAWSIRIFKTAEVSERGRIVVSFREWLTIGKG